MEQQTSFAQSEVARKKKTPRRGKFLRQMEAVVPWAAGGGARAALSGGQTRAPHGHRADFAAPLSRAVGWKKTMSFGFGIIPFANVPRRSRGFKRKKIKAPYSGCEEALHPYPAHHARLSNKAIHPTYLTLT